MDLEKDTKGDLEIVEPSSFFEDPSDYEKFNKFR